MLRTVCIFISIYMYVSICADAYIYIHIYVYVHTCMYTYMRMCIHTYMHASPMAIAAQVPDVRTHDEQLHQLGARTREPHALGGLAPLREVCACARFPVACRTRSLRLAASPRTRVSVRDIVSRTARWPARPAQAVHGAMRVRRPTASRARPPACLFCCLFVCCSISSNANTYALALSSFRKQLAVPP
jgi:hypothetical protein